MSSFNTRIEDKDARILRLTIGLVFGLAIGSLIQVFSMNPDRDLPLWANVAVWTLWLGAFIPWAGAGVMRRVNLGTWSIVAMAVIAFAAWHRLSQSDYHGFTPPFFNISFLLYPFLFIAHELIASADQSGKTIAPYSVYNDEAWHRGVQLALAVMFTALFWGILILGAVLLGMIGFKWLGEWLQKPWIGFPLSGLAIGAAVHLGDSQPKLINGVRALVLGILSWLLPVLTAIALLFAVSLAFSGLEPLWKTKAATASLLAGCVGLVLLINAAYQEGDSERKVHIVLKWSARVACGLLLVFAVLAAYSLFLRIEQYGLTPERVLAGLGALIALLFGLGYAAAAVWPKGQWLRWIEGVNVTMAFVMAALFLAVVTPVGDPNRLSVESQVAKLQAGRIAVDKFDWAFLKYGGQGYGRDALKALTKAGKTEAIRKEATDADHMDRVDGDSMLISTTPPDLNKLAVVYPVGGKLPESFIQTAFGKVQDAPGCLGSIDEKVTPCNGAAIIDLNRDGSVEVLVQFGNHLTVLGLREGKWQAITTIYLDDADVAAFKSGKLATRRPTYDNLQIGERATWVIDEKSMGTQVKLRQKGAPFVDEAEDEDDAHSDTTLTLKHRAATPEQRH